MEPSLDNNWGEQAQPIVYNGVMYVTNARHTVAIDVATGKQIWKHYARVAARRRRASCAAASPTRARRSTTARSTAPRSTPIVLALDAKTGKEVWKSKVAEWKDGFSLTLAPLIANGVLVIGNSGAEFGVRGFIDGWDPETGKQPVAPLHHSGARREGQRTWPQDNNAWEVGGGSAWITGSYDPELDLMYWGTGNPAPWASQTRPGDNLYTSSVLAHAAEDRRDRLVLPVHAQRRLRLRRLLGADQRRHQRRRAQAQGRSCSSTATASSTCSTAPTAG